MYDSVLQTWNDCREYVARECHGRPATHGLAHMEGVTQLSLLIAAMEGIRDEGMLRDIVRVAMLHDVADHKYDVEGTLTPRVREFVSTLYGLDGADEAGLAWASIDAVSFSKEKKRGMRYFVEALGPRWTSIRDIVSDADKLLAIGEDGLQRCWNFQLEMMHAKGVDIAKITPASITTDVVEHAHDKLLRLSTEYVVTPSGKFLAAPKHAEMESRLVSWTTAPPVTLTYPTL
jgi:HD superfamily phosphodiesterase